MPARVTTIAWDELRSRYLELCESGEWASQPAMGRLASEALSGESVKWRGGSSVETRAWLANGYHPKAFVAQDLAHAPRRRKRAAWGEVDGDVDTGRLYGGADDFYLTRADRDARPGLSVDVQFAFSAKVGHDVIEGFGAWIASLISTLESDGYDLEVAITIPIRGMLKNDPRGEDLLRIVVKRPNTVSDFSDWSAIFAPTGFRHILLTAFGMAADALRGKLTPGLGRPVTNGWRVTNEDGRVTIGCAGRGAVGGAGEVARILTSQAQECGLLNS